MGQLAKLIAVTCVCYVHATSVNPDNIEVEKFTAAESKSGRNLYKPVIKDNVAAPTGPRPNNVVYGKAGKAVRPTPQVYLSTQAYQPTYQPYVAPTLKGKPLLSKFKPSVEDGGYESEGISTYAQGYKPSQQETIALQKYMQRYANQVFNAPKPNFGSEPYKKFIPSAPQKYKFVPVFSQESAKPTLESKHRDYDTVEINTEKYVNPFPPKSPPKKLFTSYDSSLQPSDYKYTNQEIQLANQVMEEPEKSSWGSVEPYQYGVMTVEKNSDLAKITGYKIPAATSISVGHSIETKEEEKGHHEEHYPHHEPKYEYMYQVHDPEKHNNFGHSEARKGKNTWGRYYVQLPDGRLETVKYWVDKSGYHAEVDFKGEAKHPSHKEYSQHETPDKGYSKSSDTAGLGGHSESSFTLSDAIPIEEF